MTDQFTEDYGDGRDSQALAFDLFDEWDKGEEARMNALELEWMQANPLPSRRYLILTYLGCGLACLLVWAIVIAGIVWVAKEVL